MIRHKKVTIQCYEFFIWTYLKLQIVPKRVFKMTVIQSALAVRGDKKVIIIE